MIRKAYIRKIEDRIARLEEDIDRLRDRMAAPEGKTRDWIDREIPVLRAKAETARKRIRAVEAAEATNWGHLKYSVEEGLKNLGQSIDQMIEKMRKTGSHGQ